MTDILAEREKTHGQFMITATVSQDLKRTLRHASAKWETLSNEQKEALDGICVKLARIVCGDPDETDHWIDIMGYAKLVWRRGNGKS
jgi:hypothetical protein